MISTFKRIAIFYPWGNLGAFSSLRDALALLIEHGCQVDFYSLTDGSYPQPDLDLQGLTLIDHPEFFPWFTGSYPKIIRQLKRGGRPYRWLIRYVVHPIFRRTALNKYFRDRQSSHPYNYIIGMDPEGLTLAAPLAKKYNIALIYWSLELLFAGEITNQEQKRLKNQELVACKQSIFTIVQDRWRGQALMDENGLKPGSLFYVPVAPRGKACREKSDYLYRRLNISPKRKVVLYTGSIVRGTMAAEIVSAAVNWPDDYILVMQSRNTNHGFPNEYWDSLLKLVDPDKVIISFDPVPQSDFRCMVDSADIGLAFHMPLDSQNTKSNRNIYLMGLSSGKIAGYLQSGLPIIVNDAVVGPREVVKTSQCGICVEKPEEIKAALAAIFDRYDWYSANACRCFDQEMELEWHFTPVIEQITL